MEAAHVDQSIFCACIVESSMRIHTVTTVRRVLNGLDVQRLNDLKPCDATMH